MSDDIPQNTFLIVNGAEIVPLNKSVINMGRSEENEIVIQNPHISRFHAQIRAVDGQFHLVDLKSTGGTSVNGEKVNQVALYPGDVISLAGTPIIFGQSEGSADIANIPAVSKRVNKSGHIPTRGITDSVDIASVDRFLEMFDGDEETTNPGKEKKS